MLHCDLAYQTHTTLCLPAGVFKSTTVPAPLFWKHFLSTYLRLPNQFEHYFCFSFGEKRITGRKDVATEAALCWVTWESSMKQQEFSWCQSLNYSVPPYCKQLDWGCPIQPKATFIHSWALDYLASFCLVFHTTILNKDKAMLGSGFTCWTVVLLGLWKMNLLEAVSFCFRTLALSPLYFSFSLWHTGGGQNNRNTSIMQSNTTPIWHKQQKVQHRWP